jgi:hypothetical protein
MKKKGMMSFASGNLMWGGVALVLTGIFIATGSPKNLIVFMTPYSGTQVVFSRILDDGLPCIDARVRYKKISIHHRDNIFSFFKKMS